MWDKLVDIDKQLFLFLNANHNKLMDMLMWHISGKLEWIPLYLILIYFLIKQYQKKELVWIFGGLFLTVVLTDQISVHCFKNVFERLRPCHDPEISSFAHIVNDKCGGKYGFVSSHASNAFGLASYFFMLFKKQTKWGIVLFLFAALISYSRIYLGVHFPADIFSGALLGVIIGYVTYHLVQYKIKRT